MVDQSNTNVAANIMAKKLRRMNAQETFPEKSPKEAVAQDEQTVFPQETVVAETFLPDDQFEGTCLDEATTIQADWTYVPTELPWDGASVFASRDDGAGQEEP